MKKLALSAIAVLVLAASSSNAFAFSATRSFNDKPKTTAPDSGSDGGPQTNSIPPGCPYNDPNGCGILD